MFVRERVKKTFVTPKKVTLNVLPVIRICDYSLHLQIPLSQVLSFAIIIHNTNNTIEHGSSQPSMQKQRGQCGVL